MEKIKSEIEILAEILGKPVLSTAMVSAYDAYRAMAAHSDQFKYITTTCGKEVLFDDQDYHALRNISIFLDNNQGQLLTVWTSKNKKRTTIPVAKLLLGVDGKTTIDYKDRNRFNLKRENISIIPRQVAQFKNKMSKNNTSGFKGVSWKKEAKRYEASIKVEGKKKHLGYFPDVYAAAHAYNEACIKYYGEQYSNLNIIPRQILPREIKRRS